MGDIPGEELQKQQLDQPLLQSNVLQENNLNIQNNNLAVQHDLADLQQNRQSVQQEPDAEVDIHAKEGNLLYNFLSYAKAVTKLDLVLEKEGFDAALETGKKDSSAYVQLRRAINRVKELFNAASREKKIDPGDALAAAMRLGETATGYYDLHRGTRLTNKGISRKESAVKLHELSNEFYHAMAKDLNLEKRGADEEVPFEDKAIYATSYENTRKHTKRLTLLVKSYKKWAKHFAFQEGREREKIKEKLFLFAPYEEDIKAYEEGHKSLNKKYDPEIKDMIDLWHEYKLRDRVLSHFEKDENLKEKTKDTLQDMITEHADRYGEKEKEKKISGELDQSLSKNQLILLDKIDQWFIRNYNNSGIIGKVFGVCNHHGEIISELFSKSKRERLFIYYLIETGKRKSPEVLDVFNSQISYIPNVDKFKDQLIASKLKVITHLTGTYIYMNKLTEAMQINRAFKDEIKNAAEIEQKSLEQKEAPSIEEPMEEKNEKDVLEGVRQDALIKFYTAGKEYRELMLRTAAEKDNKTKAFLESETKKKAGELETARQRLINADNAFDKNLETDTAYKPQTNVADTNFYSSLYGTAVGSAGEFTGMGTNYAMKGAAAVRNLGGKSIGRGGSVSWGLSSTQLARTNLYVGEYTTAGINAISQLVSAGAALYSLSKNAGNMNAGEIGFTVADILKNIASTGKGVFNTIQAARHYTEQIAGSVSADKAYEASKNLKIAGVVLGSVSALIGTGKTISGGLDIRNAKSASMYFKLKDQLIRNPEESERDRSKKERESRYEKNMLRLSEKMSKHKTLFSAMDTVISIMAPAGLVIPGLGLVSIGAGVGSSILNVSMLGDVKTDMIDQYLQLDSLYENCLKKMKEDHHEIHDKKAFKEQLRRRLLASAGFSDVASAADQIAKRYTDFIRYKLFNPEANISETERNGYIQLIKSFGLPYDEEKGKPDAYMLARKISGR
ncbi:MAG: hypothetical protein IKQ49_05550 [Eubacterium sp.]|nr:hypothetical protein [Eubacterium sp.]